jgi:hypothetical protein
MMSNNYYWLVGLCLCFTLIGDFLRGLRDSDSSCRHINVAGQSQPRRRPLSEAIVNLDEFVRASGPAPFPKRAYMITTRNNEKSGRTAHAVEQVRLHLNITNVEFIYGPSDLRDEDFGCEALPGSNCRAGVGWGAYTMWKAIAADGVDSAFVLDDDVLFHDDTKSLLPLYWDQVPPTFEIVYFGSFPSWLVATGPSKRPHNELVTFGTAPYAHHCYILTRASALRFANLYTEMFRMRGRREEPGIPEIGPTDLFGDTFASTYALRTAFDPHNWVSFENTDALPAKWGGIVFLDQQKLSSPSCICNNEYSKACRGYLPIQGVGLAYQHDHCANMTRFYSWVAHYKEDYNVTF